MPGYIAKRLLLLPVTVLGVTLLTFSLMHFAPGDPAEVVAIARYGIEGLSEEEVEWIRVREGLDAPIYVQYGKWLSHLVHGDLGNSLATGKPVLDEILSRFPATIQLALASLVISLVIAIPLGVVAATRRHSAIDHASMLGAVLGFSMPNFWLGLLLILVFSVYLGWFPVCGQGGIEHLVLPAVTLGTGIAALTTRITRASMLEVLGQNYIRTARAKGLPERVVAGKHALKNALIPVVTIVGLQLAFLLEGSVIVEKIFAWPGVGRLLVDSIFNRDLAMIQGCALFVAVIFVLANLVVDVSYAFLDPRIRYEKKTLG